MYNHNGIIKVFLLLFSALSSFALPSYNHWTDMHHIDGFRDSRLIATRHTARGLLSCRVSWLVDDGESVIGDWWSIIMLSPCHTYISYTDIRYFDWLVFSPLEFELVSSSCLMCLVFELKQYLKLTRKQMKHLKNNRHYPRETKKTKKTNRG